MRQRPLFGKGVLSLRRRTSTSYVGIGQDPLSDLLQLVLPCPFLHTA